VTLFDLIAIGILLVSGLIGFTRGAVRELVTVFAFTLAALASVYLLPITGPLMRDLMEPRWAANAAAVVTTFVIAYIALRVAAHWLTARLHEQAALGAIDRTIGVAFGVLRALVFLGVFYLVFNMATPSELVPRWISEGRLYPVARVSARLIEAVAPQSLKASRRLGPVLERVVTDGDNTTGSGPNSAPASPSRSGNPVRNTDGYDKRSRDDIDALVERSR
jgi:membrane protein required for colicin V production